MDAARFDGWTQALVARDRRRLLRGATRFHSGRCAGHECWGEGCELQNSLRKRGEACEKSCQCGGDYRCGKPRNTPAEREACGQHQNANEICCLGQGDTRGGNDCACCGGLNCTDGRRQPECLKRGGFCCPGGRCRGNQCVANYATLADCKGQCDSPSIPGRVTVFDKELVCPSCDQCQVLGCFGEVAGFNLAIRDRSQYCRISSTLTSLCFGLIQGPSCPSPGDICNSQPPGQCFTVCLPS